MSAQTENRPFTKRIYEAHHRKRWMAPVLGRLCRHGAEKGLEQRHYDELASSLAESLEGKLETEYSFEIARIGEGTPRLVASDGELFEDMLLRNTYQAGILAAEDDFYDSFLLARALHEQSELAEWEDVVGRRAAGNTRFTFSPYSEEAGDPTDPEVCRKLIKASQKPYLKRAMIRMFYFDGTRGHILSRSIDGSRVELLKKAASEVLDYTFIAVDSTNMLGERIKGQYISLGEARSALDAVVVKAEQLRGWPDIDTTFNAQKLVESQSRIIKKLLKDARTVALSSTSQASYDKAMEHLIYNSVALLEEVIQGKVIHGSSLKRALAEAGATARSESKEYNACGAAFGSNETDKEAILRALGFGMVAERSVPHCPFCGAKATGDACGDMQCTDEAKCGSELKKGKVIRRKGTEKKIGWAAGILAYWRGLQKS